MKLSEFKKFLLANESIDFYLPNGDKIPSHFHITEVGLTTKNFTDCGNVFRIDKKANLQIWVSTDFWHRLDNQKVSEIIENATQKILDGKDLEIQIEYQNDTIGIYGLEIIENKLYLTNTKTDCLAKDSCEFPLKKVKIKLKDLHKQIASCCEPINKIF